MSGPIVCAVCGETFTVEQETRRMVCPPCLAEIRTRAGWNCDDCGSADPFHAYPCPGRAGAEQ